VKLLVLCFVVTVFALPEMHAEGASPSEAAAMAMAVHGDPRQDPITSRWPKDQVIHYNSTGGSQARLTLLASCMTSYGLQRPKLQAGILLHDPASPGAGTCSINDATHVISAIGKCGSSTLKGYSKTFLGGRECHELPSNLTEVLPRIAFVRDPIERFVSGALEIVFRRSYTFRGEDGNVYNAHTHRGVPFLESVPSHPQSTMPGRLRETVSSHPSVPMTRGWFTARDTEKGTNVTRMLDDFVVRLLNQSLLQNSVYGHIAPQVTHLLRHAEQEPPPRGATSGIAYLGMVHDMAKELYILFGSNGSVPNARPSSRKELDVDASPSLARVLCHVYKLDVCCLDISFRARCKALDADPCDTHSPVPPSFFNATRFESWFHEVSRFTL